MITKKHKERKINEHNKLKKQNYFIDIQEKGDNNYQGHRGDLGDLVIIFVFVGFCFSIRSQPAYFDQTAHNILLNQQKINENKFKI